MGKLNMKEFEDYFNDIFKELEKEFEKSDEYSKKIDAELKRFEGSMLSKGTQYYLIEHLKNAIELQSQRQALIKDKFAIKKAILDYAMKNQDDENAGKTLFNELSKIIKLDKEKFDKLAKKIDEKKEQELDKKIDELVQDSEKEED
jgi:hypothetical protein